jgi:hypothetical protein
VNSQNKMNAGAEYVLYRIWATLQDPKGIHAESLLTCLGALAGHACQAYVRQAAALPGADPRRYELLTVDASDGKKYLYGEALMVPLVESSLSVWALAGRTVQMLDEPLPDIQDIVRHVTQTVGTSSFGVPRVPDGHHPRHSAAVYVKHIWPQILPVAQRFCRKPMQVPVLFGIALQRAIEHTKDLLSPTLSASIAMECAVAMAKVVVPEAEAALPVTRPIALETDAVPGSMTSPASGKNAEPTIIRAPLPRTRRSTGDAEASTRGVGALVARLPPAAHIVTIATIAFMTVAGATYQTDRREAPETAREERGLALPNSRASTPALAQAAQEAQSAQDFPFAEEAPVSQQEETAAPILTANASAELGDYSPPPLQSNSDGNDEGVMRDEYGQPMR